MIFQDPFACLHPMYRVGDQIAEAVNAHFDVSRSEARRRAVEMLERVGLPNAPARARDYPHQFSGGMRQRAMIAMALVNNPSLLIADEPTTALDVTVQAQILELIDEVKRDFDIGVILVTHDLGVVSETADTVLVMYARPRRRARAGAGDLPRAAAPVHVGPARLDADDRGAPRVGSSRSRERRRPREPAQRVRVPSPLPLRVRALPGRPAEPAPARGRPLGCVPPVGRRRSGGSWAALRAARTKAVA